MTTTVWLTTWQLGDDGVSVAVGDRVDWLAFPPTDWEEQRLFAGRRTIDLAVDAHRAAGIFVDESGVVVSGEGPVWSVRGVVAGVEAVTVEHRRVGMDDELVDGSAVAEAVDATDDRSWGMCRAHDPTGFLVTVRDEHVEPTEPTLARDVWSADPLPTLVIDQADAEAHTFPDATEWSQALPDVEPWPASLESLPDVADGETFVVFASYDEPADAASWCRHPSHRA